MTEHNAEKDAPRYAPGTVLRDAAGHYWMVRDDGMTAAGTNGGVMVDLRRGERVFSPVKERLTNSQRQVDV